MFLITTLIRKTMMLLPCMNPKFDVIIKILNLGSVLCCLKSYYIKQRYKFVFFPPHLQTRPLRLHLSLCIECSALGLSKSFVPKDPSHCYISDWGQYPPAPSVCQEQGAFTSWKPRGRESPRKKDGLSRTGKSCSCQSKETGHKEHNLYPLFPLFFNRSTTEMSFSVPGVNGSSLAPHMWDSRSCFHCEGPAPRLETR